MGELVIISQPRGRSALPSTLGILGSSKGNTAAVGSGWTGGSPAVAPVNPAQVASVLQTLNTIATETPQKITATGETLRTPTVKAATLPQWVRPSAPPPPPAPVYVPVPYILPGELPTVPTVAPRPPFPGGGGGGGGAAASDDQGAPAADPPVFLGLTQKQLMIGGGLALVAFLLLRKRKPGASSSSSASSSEAL